MTAGFRAATLAIAASARYLIAIGAQQTDDPAVNVNWQKKTFGTAQMTQLGIKKHPSVKRGISLGC
jgi:hypothetical protein